MTTSDHDSDEDVDTVVMAIIGTWPEEQQRKFLRTTDPVWRQGRAILSALRAKGRLADPWPTRYVAMAREAGAVSVEFGDGKITAQGSGGIAGDVVRLPAHVAIIGQEHYAYMAKTIESIAAERDEAVARLAEMTEESHRQGKFLRCTKDLGNGDGHGGAAVCISCWQEAVAAKEKAEANANQFRALQAAEFNALHKCLEAAEARERALVEALSALLVSVDPDTTSVEIANDLDAAEYYRAVDAARAVLAGQGRPEGSVAPCAPMIVYVSGIPEDAAVTDDKGTIFVRDTDEPVTAHEESEESDYSLIADLTKLRLAHMILHDFNTEDPKMKKIRGDLGTLLQEYHTEYERRNET